MSKYELTDLDDWMPPDELDDHLSEGARAYMCELSRTHPDACDRITDEMADYIATHPPRAGRGGV